MDNPNDSEDDWEADNESDTELENGSEDSETPEVRNANAAPNVRGLIRPIWWSKKKVEKDVQNGQYNGHEEDQGDQEKVGQNVSMYYHQVYYVVWQRILFRELLRKNVDQSRENIH